MLTHLRCLAAHHDDALVLGLPGPEVVRVGVDLDLVVLGHLEEAKHGSELTTRARLRTVIQALSVRC